MNLQFFIISYIDVRSTIRVEKFTVNFTSNFKTKFDWKHLVWGSYIDLVWVSRESNTVPVAGF